MARGAFLVLSEKVNGRGGDGGGDSGNGGSARETLPVVSRCHEASPSLPPSLPLSLSLSIYLSIYLSIHPSIYLSLFFPPCSISIIRTTRARDMRRDRRACARVSACAGA